MIRKENKSGPWTVMCDTKNSFVSRKYGTIMEGKECRSFWYGSVLGPSPVGACLWSSVQVTRCLVACSPSTGSDRTYCATCNLA